MDEEVLAALPGILREAEGTPEYPQLWWAWSTLSSAAPMSEGWRDGTFDDGSRAAGSAACGNRIARLCGGAEGAAGRCCVGRIFKAVMTGLSEVGAAEQLADAA